MSNSLASTLDTRFIKYLNFREHHFYSSCLDTILVSFRTLFAVLFYNTRIFFVSSQLEIALTKIFVLQYDLWQKLDGKHTLSMNFNCAQNHLGISEKSTDIAESAFRNLSVSIDMLAPSGKSMIHLYTL